MMVLVCFGVACAIFCAGLILALEKNNMATTEDQAVPTVVTGPESIVIIDVLLETDYNGRQVFVLKYAIDGYTDSVMIYESSKLRQYIEHLKTLGNVEYLDDVPIIEGVTK
jgi:hypothetical protein